MKMFLSFLNYRLFAFNYRIKIANVHIKNSSYWLEIHHLLSLLERASFEEGQVIKKRLSLFDDNDVHFMVHLFTTINTVQRHHLKVPQLRLPVLNSDVASYLLDIMSPEAWKKCLRSNNNIYWLTDIFTNNHNIPKKSYLTFLKNVYGTFKNFQTAYAINIDSNLLIDWLNHFEEQCSSNMLYQLMMVPSISERLTMSKYQHWLLHDVIDISAINTQIEEEGILFEHTSQTTRRVRYLFDKNIVSQLTSHARLNIYAFVMKNLNDSLFSDILHDIKDQVPLSFIDYAAQHSITHPIFNSHYIFIELTKNAEQNNRTNIFLHQLDLCKPITAFQHESIESEMDIHL